MTAAPPVPATRAATPWSPWCWLEVQIATATGSTGAPDRVGYWQPTPAQTGDQRYTVWQADSVVPPAAGVPAASGYGEWTGGATGAKWSSDWSTLSWQAVDCDLTAATFETGSAPWEWNAPPGNGSLSLVDPEHIYFPAGPGSGAFDDIGVNTPVRVVAHLTALFDQAPANAAARQASRVLITGLVRSIGHTVTPDGHGVTVIAFSEPHVLYGRVNRPATPVVAEPVNTRLQTLAGLSDDPTTGLLPRPSTTTGGRADDGRPTGTDTPWSKPDLQAGQVAGDLWTEISKSLNSVGQVVALQLYPSTVTSVWGGGFPEYKVGNGSPRVYGMPPHYPIRSTGNGDSYGLDVRTVTTECSAPAATFNYTKADAAARVRLALSPVTSIQLTHDDSLLANVVSVSATGGTATVYTDQPSIDRWYRHTYQRHDLLYLPGAENNDIVGWRILERLKGAVLEVADCAYVMSEPRDFDFAVGAAPADNDRQDHPPVEPGRWLKLDWGWVTADLRVTRVAHSITPAEWTVTHSYEIHHPVTQAGAL